LKLTNEKQELPVAAMFIKQIINKSAIFIKDFPKAALPNEPKHGRKHPCRFFYKDCSLSSDLLTNMAAKSNSCF
jgi:hypothetical protein